MQASWHSAYANFFAVVDVDAGGGGHVGAHCAAHQVVVMRIRRACRAVGHRLVDAHKHSGPITHALVDDLAVFYHVAKSAPLLIISIMVRLSRERRQQVAHITTVKADAWNNVRQRIALFIYIDCTKNFLAVNCNWISYIFVWQSR